MKIQLNSTDKYMTIQLLINKVNGLAKIENVCNFVTEQEFKSRIALLKQALALFNMNTHEYYGDSINDTYKDLSMSVTGLDNLITDINEFITRVSVYIPGGDIIE